MALVHIRLTGDPGAAYESQHARLGALGIWSQVGRDVEEGSPALMLFMLIAIAIIPSAPQANFHCTENRNQDAPKCLYFGYRAAV